MKLVLCTLFDSNYIDKGLVMYSSLEKVCDEFALYVLPMDEKCSEILKTLNLSHMVILDYKDFEDADLRKVKQERSRAEFCWTCTGKLIKYVLEKYSEKICTYIDADLYFYADPQQLIDEMIEDHASVQVIKHNFSKKERKIRENADGIYCVQFNTFLNNKEGHAVLNEWINDCLNECSYGKTEGVLGDQKYLEKWPSEYDYINICQNMGAGVAPWNINRFDWESFIFSGRLSDRETKRSFDLVFYHFQDLVYRDEYNVECCYVLKKNLKIVKSLYSDYLYEIVRVKKMLNNRFDLDIQIKVHPAKSASYEHKKTMKDRLKKIFGRNFVYTVELACYMMKKRLYAKRYETLLIDTRNLREGKNE